MGSVTLPSPRRGVTAPPHFLREFGVFGFEPVEPVLFAALVSECPLLLVGRCGTGKTHLLNSLSEALGLEHRHYNASLISFDDLVGFPQPDKTGESVVYLPTPATIWSAQSVLVDEINRCKPEHQNRFFSLIHERRIQGMPLPQLRYRWAAMNPPGDQAGESYLGTEPLDPALADRFGFVVEVADWDTLGEEDRYRIADPAGEGRISRDRVGLASALRRARRRFEWARAHPPAALVRYCAEVATLLGRAGMRLSPRRVRQLAQNLLALTIGDEGLVEEHFLLGLRWSLPQRATGGEIKSEILYAAHREAWDAHALTGPDLWAKRFTRERSLVLKTRMLLGECPDADTGSIAVSLFLREESWPRLAAWTLAVYPHLLNRTPGLVGAEGLNDLGKFAQALLEISGRRTWRDTTKPSRWTAQEGVHPDMQRVAPLLENLPPARRRRASLLFQAACLKGHPIPDPAALEAELDECVRAVRSFQRRAPTQT